MNKLFLIIILLFLFIGEINAQQCIISGRITNSETGESIPGAIIVADERFYCSSDSNGFYFLKVDPGQVKLSVSYLGYLSVDKYIKIENKQSVTENIYLKEEGLLIDGVVISAGKYEQKLSDVIVSMEIIRAEAILNQNTNEISEALNKIPGLDIVDCQPSIRGGSGYSYGAGSRVLLLVDGLPILTPDAGDAKWNFVPIENISQIEILKGASSALFGSSALNGVINIRTAFPKEKPETKLSINSGVFMNPYRKELIWWGSSRPSFSGLNFQHSRKEGPFDIVVAVNAYNENGFREKEGETHARTNMNLRYRDKKIKGLSYGVNANYMWQDKTDFFLWQNADSGAWKQNLSAISRNEGYKCNADPYIIYHNKNNSIHSLKTRYFRSVNLFSDDTAKNNISGMLFGEYQYQIQKKEVYNINFGLSGSYGKSSAQLFGEHHSVNTSTFLQADWKLLNKISLSIGARLEYFKIDSSESSYNYKLFFPNSKKLPFFPVVRAGVNYPLFKYTYLRTSFGQGYRFPTIAEKYIHTSVGGLNIFPNPDLKPETGWSAEIGLKQGLKWKKWNGYIDVAGFVTEYSNMMEFIFGIYKPDTAQFPTLNDLGFKSINVGQARISGFDITLTGEGQIFSMPLSFLAGYTYTNPVDLVNDSVYTASKSTNSDVLKYRYYHSLKSDFEIYIGNLTLGMSFIYTSRIINIDKQFEEELIPGIPSSALLPGLKEYREKNNKDYFVVDLRIGYNFTKNSKAAVIIKNLLNNEYMIRPGLIEAPRNIAIQYVLNF